MFGAEGWGERIGFEIQRLWYAVLRATWLVPSVIWLRTIRQLKAIYEASISRRFSHVRISSLRLTELQFAFKNYFHIFPALNSLIRLYTLHFNHLRRPARYNSQARHTSSSHATYCGTWKDPKRTGYHSHHPPSRHNKTISKMIFPTHRTYDQSQGQSLLGS